MREQENGREKHCLDILASAVLMFILSYIRANDSMWGFFSSNPGVRRTSSSGTRFGRRGVEGCFCWLHLC